MIWKPYVLLAGLFAAGCGQDPFGAMQVVSVSADHVTIRYTKLGVRDILASTGAMAQAQCEVVGKRALFQWDIQLIDQDFRQPDLAQYGQYVAPGRLRRSAHHHAHFLCVSPSEARLQTRVTNQGSGLPCRIIGKKAIAQAFASALIQPVPTPGASIRSAALAPETPAFNTAIVQA